MIFRRADRLVRGDRVRIEDVVRRIINIEYGEKSLRVILTLADNPTYEPEPIVPFLILFSDDIVELFWDGKE